MNPKRAGCVFCERRAPDIKMTREHVFPQWLRDHFGAPRSYMTLTSHYVNASGETVYNNRVIPQSSFELTSKQVCNVCNNTWLSDMEGPMLQSLLVKLAKGRKHSLDVHEATCLAAWIAKTSLVRALLDKGRRVIPPHHYRGMRESFSPPEHTYVWLAHIEEHPEIWHRHKRVVEFNELDGLEVTGHITTVWLGKLLMISCGFSDSPSSAPTSYIDARMRYAYGGALRRIWPFPDRVTLLPSFLAIEEVKYLSQLPEEVLRTRSILRRLPFRTGMCFY